MQNEYFEKIFLTNCSNVELVVMQHELRRFPEDREKLDAVLKELQKRRSND